MQVLFDLILSFRELFDAFVDAPERFVLPEDVAYLHRAAGRYRLAGHRDAHGPHDESIFAPEFLRRADETVVDRLRRPRGERGETRTHFPEHIECGGLVALGLFVDIKRRVVFGQRVEKAELSGDVGELFGTLLQNGGDERGVIRLGLDRPADPRLGGAGKRLRGHRLDIFAVEIRQLLDVEDRRGLGNAGHIERFRQLGDRIDFPLAAGRPAEKRDVVHDRLREEALRDKILVRALYLLLTSL